MIWFFVFFGLAIAIPSMLLLTGLAVILVSLPFLVLLSIGIAVLGFTFSLLLWPMAVLFDPVIALVLAVIVARYFFSRAPVRSPLR